VHAGFGKRPEETDRSSRTGTAPQADFHRPPTPLICAFIDAQRGLGRGVESICSQLTELGLPVAPRTFRAWKTAEVCARARSDAALLDILLHVRTGGVEGRPLPEVLYRRRKMTAWLARNGFPDVGKHTVDRLQDTGASPGSPIR